MGDKMNYTVAIDKDEATAKAYLRAFEIGGIPHAFVVDQKGAIAWHQNPHPSLPRLDEVLDQVLAGKFDLAAAKKLTAERKKLMAERQKEALAERQRAQLVAKQIEEYFRLVQSAGKEPQASKLGKKIIEDGHDNDSLMNHLAWEILTKEGIVSRDLKLALTAAEAANKVTKGESPSVLDTYALALFENGEKKKAVKVQTKAVELAKQGAMPEGTVAELSERLERFKQEAD
jgi:hypothetical protein